MEKKSHSCQLKCLLIVVFLLLGHAIIYAQSNPSPKNVITSDTTALKKQKQGFLGFFKRLFSVHDKKKSTDYVRNGKKFKLDTAIARKTTKPKPFDLTKGSITWTSLYTRGVNLNTGVTGLYSLGQLSQGFDVYGVPLLAQGTGVFNNGQFQKDYSSYSVNFDMETYLNEQRNKAKNALLNRKVSDKIPNYSDSLDAYESLRKKLQSPSYQAEVSATKLQFESDEDSMKKHPGSDTTELHTLRTDLYLYKQLEKRYDQLFAIKKNYNSLVKADSSEKKYEQEEKMLNNPGGVEKVLDKNQQLSKYEHFLMGVQKFSIGQCSEEISEFTLHSFVMKGVNVGYKSDDVYTEVGYGKEIAAIDPFLITGINVPNYNRTVEFARAGEGTENGSNFYATIIKIADPGGANSINETNWIYDITKQIAFGKNVQLQAEIAKSNFSYVPGNFTLEPLTATSNDINTLAYALRGKGTIPGLKTVLKMEVSKTGDDFVTLGNPYLITGATKYEIELSQQIGKKLNVDIGGTHMIETPVVSDESKETENWIQFTILYRPITSINIEFKYAPSQFQQESGTVYANSTTNNINQISFTGTMLSKIFGKDATTSVFAGNFQYSTNAAESSQLLSQNLNLSYYMVNEIVMLGPTQGINLSIDESRNNWTGSLSQFIAESTYNWSLKKTLTIALGPQWVEQPGIIADEAGLTCSLNGSVQKWIRIGLQVTSRNSMEKPLGPDSQYLVGVNISVLW